MFKTIRFSLVALLAALFLFAPAVKAQDAKDARAAEEAAAARRKVQIPLKIQLVLSRYQGEKKISSVPFVMLVTTNDPTTKLRMGQQVPVPTTTFGAAGVEGKTIPVSSYSLKQVGTDIDCSATPGVDNGVYKISLTVNDASYTMTKAGEGTMPSFRNFTSTFSILLRDGQTAQYTSATDPVNGEVLKIDATLNVVK